MQKRVLTKQKPQHEIEKLKIKNHKAKRLLMRKCI